MKMNTSNEYLKTLLDPTQFIADIPDDIMIRHINRSETITYNLKTGASGTGLIVFYPNTPSSVAGFHYRWDAENSVWAFDQYIYTAQELKKSYDYGRLISGAVSVKSSSIPSGVYALTGTFNAVWFQGTLSEVSDLNYDRILSITSNPLDKVGNVLVGDGLAVLSLPQGFNNPYVRLGDESPSSLTSVTHITNTSQNLGYGGAFAVPQTTVAGQGTFFKEFNINVDSVGPIDVTWSGLMTMQDEWTVTANYQPLNLSGTLIQGSMRTIIWSNVGVSNGSHYMNLNEINVSFFHENPPPEPVAAIKVHITFGNNTNGESTMNVDGSFTFHVVGGATIGVNSPTVMIGYQGVASGSTITLSGVNNYELVPNPALQKNLPMSYGTCDPTDLNYVKYILSNREKLGIRSVMTLAQYAKMKMQMNIMTDYHVDDREASSFDFWHLLKQIKKLVVPVASTMLPQFAPIIGAADNLANAVLGNSASGQPIGNSASGLPISMTRRIKSAHSADTPIGDSNWEPTRNPEFNKLDVIYDVSHSSMALFPVIMMDNDQVVPSDPEELFIAVSLTESLRKQIPGIDTMPYYTIGGHRVYNAVSNGRVSTAPFLTSDYILLPCYQLFDGKLATSKTPNKVTGTSHQLALYAAEGLQKRGIMGKAPYAAFTGSVAGQSVGEVFGISLKSQLTDSLGIPLFGNSQGLKPIQNLHQLERLLGISGDVPRRTPRETPNHWTASSASVPFSNTNPFLNGEVDQERNVQFLPTNTNPFLDAGQDVGGVPPQQMARIISDDTRNAFLEDGQSIPSSQEKIVTVHEFLLQNQELLEAMFGLISRGHEKALVNMVTKAALNIKTQAKELTEERLARLEVKVQNLARQGIVLDPENVKRAGRITQEDTQAAISRSKDHQMRNKLRRVFLNNVSIGREYTEDEFVDFWIRQGFIPNGLQISAWLREEDWSSPTPALSKRHYDSYLQMLGPSPDQGLVEQVRSMVDSVYDENGNKGPSQDQARALSSSVRRLISQSLVTRPQPVPKVPVRKIAPIATGQGSNPERRAALERLQRARGGESEMI
ncbi:polyprotein precursor [Culex Y virus]|nr:polyprotein precursor [Culex Y virus]